MEQKVEVWCEDNYDYMKGEAHPAKVAEFSSSKEALDYICSKLNEELFEIAKNSKSVEDLIHSYKYGGTDYYIQGLSKEYIGFSSWEYVEKEAEKIFEDSKRNQPSSGNGLINQTGSVQQSMSASDNS